MQTSLPLDTLIELAREKVDSATRTLGSLQSARSTAQRQLEMLEDYLGDYRVRLQQAVQQGLSAAGWQNYQRFIATLEAAIGEQRNVLVHAEGQLDAGRQIWQDNKRQLNSFDALAERRQRAEAVLNNRRAQKANDEFSARLVQRRAALRSQP